jgi:aryl-alcohol dehydrogenase-like predicted oxidoreductase
VSGEMPRRRLGLVGPEIAVIGFGAAALGGADSPASWGSQDDQASLAAMRRAVDHGVNWIDTAAAYGCGHSEDVIGRFLRDLPPSLRPLVFTKGGLIRSNQHGGKAFIRSLQPASVRAECEASLRRLCVDQIDMYQFHWPDETDAPVEESWGAMERLIEEGKVRFAGVSNFNVALLERCEAIRHVDSLQCPLSLIRPQAAKEEISWCLAHGVGVLGYSPMQSGLLTDAFASAWQRSRRVTGVVRCESSRSRTYPRIWTCAMRFGPPQSAMTRLSRRLRSPGRFLSRVLRRSLQARALRNRLMDGSKRRTSGSRRRTAKRSQMPQMRQRQEKESQHFALMFTCLSHRAAAPLPLLVVHER